MNEVNNNILIAIVPHPSDLKIAKVEHWYRIPLATRIVPNIVKEGSVKLLALYQPYTFGEDAHLIRNYGIVKSVTIEKRKDLLPNESIGEKSENLYYKIQIEELLELPKPIISLRKRRIIFFTTNTNKFQKAEEINDLFSESPIEEKFWEAFKSNGIFAERQFRVKIKDNCYFLDFALFCRNQKLAIECDGSAYHGNKEQNQNDSHRANLLTSKGWNLQRFTTDDIKYRFDESINLVKETINFYGGLSVVNQASKYKYFSIY